MTGLPAIKGQRPSLLLPKNQIQEGQSLKKNYLCFSHNYPDETRKILRHYSHKTSQLKMFSYLKSLPQEFWKSKIEKESPKI